jgi:hypothetical protein
MTFPISHADWAGESLTKKFPQLQGEFRWKYLRLPVAGSDPPV